MGNRTRKVSREKNSCIIHVVRFTIFDARAYTIPNHDIPPLVVHAVSTERRCVFCVEIRMIRTISRTTKSKRSTNNIDALLHKLYSTARARNHENGCFMCILKLEDTYGPCQYFNAFFFFFFSTHRHWYTKRFLSKKIYRDDDATKSIEVVYSRSKRLR